MAAICKQSSTLSWKAQKHDGHVVKFVSDPTADRTVTIPDRSLEINKAEDLAGTALASSVTAATIGRLTGLTTNGFIKTSGGNGTLSVDATAYLSGNQ